MTSRWMSCLPMNGPMFGCTNTLRTPSFKSFWIVWFAGSATLLSRVSRSGRDRWSRSSDTAPSASRSTRRSCALLPSRRVCVGPAREDAREFLDVVLVVRWHRLAVCIEAGRAVGAKLFHADAEKLQDFACVVFVRHASASIGPVVVHQSSQLPIAGDSDTRCSNVSKFPNASSNRMFW